MIGPNFSIEELKIFIKYGFFGALTTLINLFLFYILIKIGIYYIVSNVISYVIAVFISYYLNKYLVFNNRDDSQKKDKFVLLKYYLIRVISLLVDSLLLFVCVELIQLRVEISKIIISITLIIITFIFNKKYVFN